jgi:thiol-disulfide isomerase/thioredoxin
MNQAPFTLVLIYADWCPHCHEYLPTWDEFANLPGRNANMAKVHFDMQEKIPNIANAKINGYPSVIKVKPDGTIEEFKNESGESTNALPNMRDKAEMMKNLMIKPVSANNLFGKKSSNKMRKNWVALNEKNSIKVEETLEEKVVAKKEAVEETAAAKELVEKEAAKELVEKEAAKEAIQEGAKKKNKTKNVNIQPGILTSQDIFETENELIKQRGGRRKKIKSFLSGGTLLEDLRELGKYLKK